MRRTARAKEVGGPSEEPGARTATDAEIALAEARRVHAVEGILSLEPAELLAIQKLLQHGDSWGIWFTPPDWVPPGRRTPAMLNLKLRDRIEHFSQRYYGPISSRSPQEQQAHAQALDHAVLIGTRYLLMLRMGPAGLGERALHKSLDPSSISQIAYLYLPALMAVAVRKALSTDDERELLAGVRDSDLAVLSASARRGALIECKRMLMLAERGLWIYKPGTGSPVIDVTVTQPDPDPEPIRDPHQPLPDEYVAAMGKRSLWLLQNLAPNILQIAERMHLAWQQTDAMNWSLKTKVSRRRLLTIDILAAHQWRAADGTVLQSPPFPLKIAAPPKSPKHISEKREEFRWPPRTYIDIAKLFGILQMAHYFIVALSMGSRQSESLSLTRSCLVEASDGQFYASGKTYKLVQRHAGEWREWDLPDVAREAVRQQVTLVRLVEQLDLKRTLELDSVTGEHLWGQLSGGPTSARSVPLRDINGALKAYARNLWMELDPGGQALRSHRFRKSLARLVALALTQAPKLLMDVFGHRSIEMTLYYILTDQALRSDIESVSRELRVMRAHDVVSDMFEADFSEKKVEDESLGGYGGLAAVSIRAAVSSHIERLHKRGDQWGANTAYELAELLTLQGRAWSQVRHGVICTKLAGESGPCNRSKGRPEPSKCHTGCDHRLEEAFLQDDVEGCIRDSVEAYQRAVAEGEPLMQAHWAGQIRAHVPRFEILRKRWEQNDVVRSVLLRTDYASTK